MKKILFLLSLFLLCACSNDSLSVLRRDLKDAKVGVAFLGYVHVDFMIDDAILEKYDFMNEITEEEYVKYYGDEAYLIVPKKANCKVTVYEYSIDSNTNEENKGKVLYENNGTPFIIKCNISDIYSNVLIVIEDGKDIYEFQPYLSLMDSKLDLSNNQEVMDISLY